MTPARIHTLPDGRGGLFVYDGERRIGWVYPKVPSDEGGAWYGKPMLDAQQFATRLGAVAYVAGVPASDLIHLDLGYRP